MAHLRPVGIALVKQKFASAHPGGVEVAHLGFDPVALRAVVVAPWSKNSGHIKPGDSACQKGQQKPDSDSHLPRSLIRFQMWGRTIPVDPPDAPAAEVIQQF